MGNTAIVKGQTTAVAMEYCENNRHIMRILRMPGMHNEKKLISKISGIKE